MSPPTDEKLAIEKLRQELGDLLPDDYTDFDLLRWLQGYSFKIHDILPKLRHHLRFMQSYDFEKFEVIDFD